MQKILRLYNKRNSRKKLAKTLHQKYLSEINISQIPDKNLEELCHLEFRKEFWAKEQIPPTRFSAKVHSE